LGKFVFAILLLLTKIISLLFKGTSAQNVNTYFYSVHMIGSAFERYSRFIYLFCLKLLYIKIQRNSQMPGQFYCLKYCIAQKDLHRSKERT
jgi:hypothetical protein